jgi:hypothetical protein
MHTYIHTYTHIHTHTRTYIRTHTFLPPSSRDRDRGGRDGGTEGGGGRCGQVSFRRHAELSFSPPFPSPKESEGAGTLVADSFPCY